MTSRRTTTPPTPFGPGQRPDWRRNPARGPRARSAQEPAGSPGSPAQQIEHLHSRPGWDCQICGQPWPCANAKADLAVEFRRFPSVLAIYMAAQMHDALLDLTAHGTPPPPDLYERFMSWIRRSTN